MLSQKAELASILSAKGMLVDGKIVPRERGRRREPARRAGGPRPRHRMVSQHASFARPARAVVRGPARRSLRAGQDARRDRARAARRAGLRPDIGATGGAVHFTHYSDVAGCARSGEGRLCRRPDRISDDASTPAPIPAESVEVEELGTVKLELSDKLLTASLADGDAVSFDMSEAVKEVYRRGWPKVMDHRPIELKGASAGLHGTMVIDNLNGTYTEPDFRHLAACASGCCSAAPDRCGYSAATELFPREPVSRSASARAASARFRSKPFELRGPLPRGVGRRGDRRGTVRN